MTEAAAWAIFFLPLAAFLLNGLIVRPFLGPQSPLAGHVTIAAVGGAFLLSLWALQQTVAGHGEIGWASHSWVAVGSLDVRVGILMNPLTAIMLVVVTGVSLAVQVYSVGYMHGDKSYVRYYAYMALFTASMLGLVLASSVLQMFVFWELVGLSSYLLIGFWHHRPLCGAGGGQGLRGHAARRPGLSHRHPLPVLPPRRLLPRRGSTRWRCATSTRRSARGCSARRR